jgi:hypothetical protein
VFDAFAVVEEGRGAVGFVHEVVEGFSGLSTIRRA